MKEIPRYLTLSLLWATALISAQRLPSQIFDFDNVGADSGAIAPVYGLEPGNPHLQKWGNTATARPPGTQTYSGVPLFGANYSVQGFFSLTPVQDVFELMPSAQPVAGSLTTFDQPGYFFTGVRVIPEAINNVTNLLYGPLYAFLQVRVWDNAGGQLASWTDAWNAAVAGSGRDVGWSQVFYQQLDYPGPVLPPPLKYFESFNVFMVPEPSTLALALLGGAALIVHLRRRRYPLPAGVGKIVKSRSHSAALGHGWQKDSSRA